jgi:hypothetical protein
MLRQDQLRTLKQTHQTATTVMPLVTAGLAVMSVLIAAHERRSAESVSQAERQVNPLDLPRVVRVTTPRTPAPSANPTVTLAANPIAQPPERRASPIGSAVRYLATLLGTLLKVALGVAYFILLTASIEGVDHPLRDLQQRLINVARILRRIRTNREAHNGGGRINARGNVPSVVSIEVLKAGIPAQTRKPVKHAYVG